MFQRLANSILLKLTENLKVLPIYRDKEGKELYLERYHIGFLFGWRFFFHKFIGADPAGFHSHPWKYGFSILLCGEYWEETRFGFHRIKWFNTVNGDKFHRLDPIDPEFSLPTWSLFFHSPKIGNWGFLKKLLVTDSELTKLDWRFVQNNMLIIYEEVGSGAGTSIWHLNPETLTGKEWRLQNEHHFSS